MVEGLYNLCSENKRSDHFRGHREADLRLWFSHIQKAGFLMTRLILSLWLEVIQFEFKQICEASYCSVQYVIEFAI